MPFTLRSYRRFSVQCAVTYKASVVLKLPLAYFSGFWLLITLLVLSSVSAYAEWVAVGRSNDKQMTVYVDLATLRHKGDLVKMWEVFDYKTAQSLGTKLYFSMRAQAEYDCPEERGRNIDVTFFSDNMGRGELISIDSEEGKWRPVAPGSIDEILWKIACGKQ